MTELELHQNPGADLAVQMDYAKAVSSASLLPQAYRNKPADIMLAVGLGQAMGLSPAESLYRIDVIQGKPTASAELIAANVRKAGHVLRLRVDEQAVSATCTIIRADDPGYEHTVTRDREWAQQMGLMTKDNYKKQAATMLGWRAVTACARMACPEALYGVAHTADELGDFAPAAPPVPSSQVDRMRSALRPEPEATVTVEQIEPETGELITSSQTKKMGALMREVGVGDRDTALAYVAYVIGREVASRSDLTKAEASQVIESLESDRTAFAPVGVPDA